MSYAEEFRTTNRTPQTQRAHPDQIRNNGGGYSFGIDKFKRLKRFLIIGSCGNMYSTSQQMTKENGNIVLECASENLDDTLSLISSVSKERKASRRDPAIFAMALLMLDHGSQTKEIFNDVCQSSTDLFMFNEFCKSLGKGWGSTMVKANRSWYQKRSPGALARQVTKYRGGRHGWKHSDVLRKCHYSTSDPEKNNVLKYATNLDKWHQTVSVGETDEYLAAVEECKTATERRTAELISDYSLEWEHINNKYLSSSLIWDAMLPNTGMWALIRNLSRLTANGIIKGTNKYTKTVCEMLSEENILSSGTHPFKFLVALKGYSSGRSQNLTWSPVAQIVSSLDRAFTYSFNNVEPSGCNYMLGIDVSGSMDSDFMKNSTITCMEASMAMALIQTRTEKWCEANVFDNGLKKINLQDKTMHGALSCIPRNYGGTDCSLPMRVATKEGKEIDTFIVYTDNDTNSGRMHPFEALQEYRRKFNPEAKLIVVAMRANGVSIARPGDPGMLDIVGFSTDTPSLISEFSKGSI